MAKKAGTEPGDVVRFEPAPEPMVATVGVALLTLVELVFVGLFMGGLFGVGLAWGLVVLAGLLVAIGLVLLLVSAGAPGARGAGAGLAGSGLVVAFLAAPTWVGSLAYGNTIPQQQAMAFWLGSALLTLAAILSLYRKFFVPDVMIVKKRKLKYEDLY